MFDLEKAVQEWRRRMLGEGVNNPEVLDELETHLRDDLERRVNSGADAQTAFAAAVKSLGPAGRLREEFARAGTRRASRAGEFKVVVLAVCAGIAVSGSYAAIGIESRVVAASGAVACGLVLLCAVIWRRLREAGEIDFQQLAPSAQMTLQLARAEAGQFHHDFVGTEHLLLGLMQSGDEVTSRVMRRLGLDVGRVREEIVKHIGRGPIQHVPRAQPCTPRARRAMHLAIGEARTLNQKSAGTEHLLLGLVLEGGGVAALVLKALGVSPDAVRDAVRSELGGGDQ